MTFTGLEQTGLEGGLGKIVPENVGTIVATVDDVITRPGEFQPEFAGHGPHRAAMRGAGKCPAVINTLVSRR